MNLKQDIMTKINCHSFYSLDLLLSNPQVQELKGTREYELLYQMVYYQTQNLTNQQKKKAQILLISKSKSTSLDTLQSLLNVDKKDLQDLILETMELGLLVGKIDHKMNMLHVESSIHYQQNSIEILSSFLKNTDEVVKELDEMISNVESRCK